MFAQGKCVSVPSQRMTNFPLLKSFKVFSWQTIYFQPIAGVSTVFLSTVVLLVNANIGEMGRGRGGCIKMQMIYAEMHSQHFIIRPEKYYLIREDALTTRTPSCTG